MSTEQTLFLEQLKLYYDIAKHIGTLDVALLVGFAAFFLRLQKKSGSCSDNIFAILGMISFGVSLVTSGIAIMEISNRIATLDFVNSNYLTLMTVLTITFLGGVTLIFVSFILHMIRNS